MSLSIQDPGLVTHADESTPLADFMATTRCPEDFGRGVTCSLGDSAEGFFKFKELLLYGRVRSRSSKEVVGRIESYESSVSRNDSTVSLPFDLSEILTNLRHERYRLGCGSQFAKAAENGSLSRKVYYALRPLLPVFMRRHLQRLALKDWQRIPFPNWSVDTTTEALMEQIWLLVLEVSGAKRVPFIWYWPRGFEACAIMTHDVETRLGRDFCKQMIAIEQEYDIRSAFELVPEVRYAVTQELLNAIKSAGCEVCLHGLNHDGHLFSSEAEFRRRAKRINEYARAFGAEGFRSPVMYRNQAWYDAFEFSYDMSVPSVGHLDPQRGGCCTVLPYFIGDILELPLTTTQDYPLYYILRSDPLRMWKEQMNTVLSKNGLISFIIHPDYTVTRARQQLYRQLLELLTRTAADRNIWLALPGEVNRWWRERAKMRLVERNGRWCIEGDGSERATIAYAFIKGDQLAFSRQD